ncbi:hypothetical protein N9J72_00300 [Candidatus Gracilibacteria bacterium]|nr:hypothetical protein [Candidatus Gracilibacteria bacterium]
MSLTDIISQKNLVKDEIKEKYHLPKRSKILVAVCFSDTKLTQNILQGLAILPANFVIFGFQEEVECKAKNISFEKERKTFDMTGLDAVLGDCPDMKLEKLMEVGVVPLVSDKNYLGKILQEFHPGKAEGNAYLYEKGSYWSAYYALIRYLENHKFPYDNKNLVKNVVGI